MDISLLTTKFYFPPTLPVLVPRPRLVSRLQAGLRSSLTLISAPAGSGKTTLLSEWRSGPGPRMSVAWISLDPSDNDPLRFFQYLSAALETLQPDLAQELHPYLQTSGKLDIEAILIRLVNTLLCGPVIDQAALHGILNRIRDMNLKLLCLTIKEDQ